MSQLDFIDSPDPPSFPHHNGRPTQWAVAFLVYCCRVVYDIKLGPGVISLIINALLLTILSKNLDFFC